MGNGNIQCLPTSCKADEVCMVNDGVLGCFPSSPVTCRIYGDPHYITFDGKAYSFWGTCNYTIAKTCGATETQFTITARNEGQNNSATSSLNSVALDMEGLHIVMGKNKQVYVSVLFLSFIWIWLHYQCAYWHNVFSYTTNMQCILKNRKNINWLTIWGIISVRTAWVTYQRNHIMGNEILILEILWKHTNISELKTAQSKKIPSCKNGNFATS